MQGMTEEHHTSLNLWGHGCTSALGRHLSPRTARIERKVGKKSETKEAETKGLMIGVLEMVRTMKTSRAGEMVRGEPEKMLGVVAGEMRRNVLEKLAERVVGVMERGLVWEMTMDVPGKMPTSVP